MRLSRPPMRQAPAGRFPPNLPALSFSTDLFSLGSQSDFLSNPCGMEIALDQRWQTLLAKPGLTDLVLNGASHCYADTGSGLMRTRSSFETDAELTQALIELGFQTGNRIDMSRPISDFTIGRHRFHAALPFGVSTRPLVSIRCHSGKKITLEKLVSADMISGSEKDFLVSELANKSNIAVCGATSSGKTTLVGALLAQLSERVICLEQIPELYLEAPAIRLTERVANQEGLGAVSLNQLVIEALRMRPDRLVVGEVRGAEFGVLLQAMNNGHRGTMTTLHVRDLDSLPARLQMLGRLSGLSPELTTELVTSSFDLVLQLDRVDGVRRLVEIGRFTGEGYEIQRVRP